MFVNISMREYALLSTRRAHECLGVSNFSAKKF